MYLHTVNYLINTAKQSYSIQEYYISKELFISFESEDPEINILATTFCPISEDNTKVLISFGTAIQLPESSNIIKLNQFLEV